MRKPIRRLAPLLAGALVGPLGAAAALGASPAAGSAVLVLPFNAPGGADQWVGKAVQQDLLTDLSQGTIAEVMAPAALPAADDPATAEKLARQSGAATVVVGQIQKSGTEIRITGQVLDAATGRPLGNLKATGLSDNLFHVEDTLAGQVLASMPRSIVSPRVLESEQTQAAAAQEAPAAAQQVAPVEAAPPATSAPVVVAPQTDAYVYAPPASAYDQYQAAAPAYSDAYAYPDSYAYPQTYYAAPDEVYTYPAPCVVPSYTYGYADLDLFPDYSFGFDGGYFDEGYDHHDFHREGRGGYDRGHESDRHRGFDERGGGDAGRGFHGHADAPSYSGASRGAGPRSGFTRSGPYSRGLGRSFAPSFKATASRGGEGFHSMRSSGAAHSSFGQSRGGSFGGFGRGGSHSGVFQVGGGSRGGFSGGGHAAGGQGHGGGRR